MDGCNDLWCQIGFWSQPALLIVVAYFALKFMRGLYRKVTR